jgi:SAM-dependent methyltransferase
MSSTADWWQTFFSGAFVDWWLKATSPDQTRAEADFVEQALGVQPPARLLDVPCGGGRHSLELAGRGYEMTGVDISADFLKAARGQSAGGPGKVTWEQREMRDLPWQSAFAGACCLGNSFGYLDDEGNAAFVKSVARALEPGAKFVLDTSYLAEVLFPTLQERAWYPVGDAIVLAQRRYDPAAGRLHVEYIHLQDGATDRRSMSARIHTCREVVEMFAAAGFTDIQAFGSVAREPFRIGSGRLFVIGTKIVV